MSCGSYTLRAETTYCRPCRSELSRLLFRPAADLLAVLEQCRTTRRGFLRVPDSAMLITHHRCAHHLTNRKRKSRQCLSTCRLCECPLTSHLVSPIPSPPLQAVGFGSVVSIAPRLPNQWVRLVPARLGFVLVFCLALSYLTML